MSTEGCANHAIENEVYGGIDDEKSVADLKIFLKNNFFNNKNTQFSVKIFILANFVTEV